MLHPLHSFAKDHSPCPSDNLLVMFIVSLALRVKDEQILVFFFFLMVSFKKENSYLEVEIAFPLNLIKRQRERESRPIMRPESKSQVSECVLTI